MMTKKKNEDFSPFIYGKTVSIHSFTNREDDIEKLINNLTTGVNSLLISPRRWGKSSLVEKAVAEINSRYTGYKLIKIDLFTVATQQEFLELFTREIIKASSSKLDERLTAGKQFFKQLVPKLSVGTDPLNDFTVSFDWSELKKHPDEVLNLPEKIANQKDFRFIICLDEFQNLAQLDGYESLEKHMRAAWQKQKKTTYCLYGSKRHMMADIFNNPSKPFYRFGDIMLLDKIKEEKWVSFIVDGFANTGKHIKPEIAARIPQTMKNHSWYVQQLSHYTWQQTTKKATDKEINHALDEVIRTNSPLYQRETFSLTAYQINLLKAISSEEPQLTAAETLRKYNLGTSATVVKNRGILESEDIIHHNGMLYEFLDPAFEIWFRWVYFNEYYLK